jgi:hypothetical protein
VLGGLQGLRETVLHEMTHAFVRRSIPHAPTWLNEGLAGYWETLEIDNDAPEAIVGRPPRLNELIVDWTPLAELVGGGAARFYDRPKRGPAYAVAWGAVHFLAQHSPDKLRAYADAIRRGRDDLAAWNDIIGETPAAFDQKMRAVYAADQPLAQRVPRPLLPAFEPEAVRPATPAEVRLRWVRVAAMADLDAAGLARWQRQLDAIARLDPGNAELAYWTARLAQARGDVAGAITALQRGLIDHPDEARLLHPLAQLLFDGEVSKPAAQRDLTALDELFARLTRVRGSALSQATVALFTLARRGAEAARPLAEAAVARNTACVQCLDALAVVRYEANDDRGAFEAERRAVAVWPYEKTPALLLERLDFYRSRSGR